MWLEDKITPTGLADLLNYDRFVAPGIVMNNDGAFLTSFYFLGPDLEHASPEEKERLSEQVNAAALRCGTGWMWQIDHIPRSSIDYMPQGAFTDPTNALIDEEARRRFSSKEGGYFETINALTITYKPRPEIENKVAAFFQEGPSDEKPGQEAVLAEFIRTVGEIKAILSGSLNFRSADGRDSMTDDDMLTFLHWCVTGLDHPMRVPPAYVGLDTAIADQGLVTGWYPEMGDLHVRVLSIDGYAQGTKPSMMQFLYELPLEFRWSTRFIFLDLQDAKKLIGTAQTHWAQKRHTGPQFAAEVVTRQESRNQNRHARTMEDDAGEAAEENESGAVLFGFCTMTLIVMDEDRQTVNRKAKTLQQYIQRHGYSCSLEKMNAVEALRGSWPGHGRSNVQRALIQTLNLADMLPLTSVWAGLATNPSPYFPKNSPPLTMVVSTGQTPVRLHLHVSDVAHAMIQGPTGSGKSYDAYLLASQFGRYPKAQIRCFGKGESSFVLAHAIGAPYYNLGVDNIGLCPFGQVDNHAEREWALVWLDGTLKLQGLEMDPDQRNAAWRALTLLGENQARSLTNFMATVQDKKIRAALQHYTLGYGAGDLLDAEADDLQFSQYVFFETEALLDRGPKDSVPVLRYLAHRIEQGCQEGNPTLIIMDEENLHEEQVKKWLTGLRKKNAAVLITVHSLENVERSPYRADIMDSCKTQIYLPNPKARNQVSLYKDAGLNEEQIELLSTLPDKQAAIYTAPVDGKQRSRTISFQSGPATRATIGAGGREDIARAKVLIAKYGKDWYYHWLVERGCVEEARWWWQQRERMMETSTERQRRIDSAMWNGAPAHSLEGVTA